MKELFRDSFMILALILVAVTPMFPWLLKSKCPRCGKRKLEHLETVQSEQDYVTLYRCHACISHFRRLKSGPLEFYGTQEIEEDKVTQPV